MDSSIVLSIVDVVICFICLAAWSGFVVIKLFIMDFNKFYYEIPLRGKYHCTCCDKSFDGSVAYALFPGKSKTSQYSGSSVYKSGMFREPEYISYSKRILCPYCNTKQWVLVENINEINADENVRKTTNSKVISRILIYIIGTVAIILLGFALPQSFI